MIETIQQSIRAFVDSGKNVVLVYPIPEMGWDVPQLLARHLGKTGQLERLDASTSYDNYLRRSKNAIIALDGLDPVSTVKRVRPDELLCEKTSRRCLAHQNYTPLYFDNNHLSNQGADLVAEAILSHLKTIHKTDMPTTKFKNGGDR